MQTPSPDDLALNRRIKIGTSIAFLIFVLAFLTVLGWWKLVAFAIWAYAFVALVVLPFYRLYVERPIYDEGLSSGEFCPQSKGITQVAIDASVRERLAISPGDRLPIPESESWIVSFALAIVREMESLAPAVIREIESLTLSVVRWIVLLVFCYPMQHPNGHRGWFRESAFVVAVGAMVIAGAILRHRIER